MNQQADMLTEPTQFATSEITWVDRWATIGMNIVYDRSVKTK